ncbi:RagB/SusD family nutrient uptake outer membrane protein [Aegicerativicinus sediminis]|uniref:RagB/SusD family nutrient uptake outer membrane protein n=1 Tax=Aegicerativicinus sediminis TaxID=2893202 RepID=UPI001E597464|nr:RagB/SusD family nutrient uptake outer membrane protein [Aegicerativicinus sediminis]
MKIKYIVLSLVVAFTFSCENPDEFLDVLPKGRVIPSALKDYDDLLSNYAILRGKGENLRYMDPDVFMSDVVYGNIQNDVVSTNAYRWAHDLYPENGRDQDYIEFYDYIHQSNFILENIGDAEVGNYQESMRPILRGEALAQRAFEYFHAVNEYAPHYDPNNPEELAIAMPLSVDLEAQLGKSSTGDIYNQILSDLERAMELIGPDYPAINRTMNWRPGTASILALLAEVHLYMGNFSEAVNYSNQALAKYNFLYDYNNVEFRNSSNPWLGYSVGGDINAWIYGTLNQETIWNRYTQYGFRTPHLYHPDFEALYDKDNDRRWHLFSTQVTSAGLDTSPNYCYIYVGERSVGLTTYRLMLTNAEAKARTGDGSGAIAMLNQLLEMRITNFTPYTHTDNASTLQLIKNERRKELHGSSLNIFDQKRYHIYGDNVPTYTRVIPDSGDTVTLEPGDEGYYLGIAPAILNLNPNLRD